MTTIMFYLRVVVPRFLVRTGLFSFLTLFWAIIFLFFSGTANASTSFNEEFNGTFSELWTLTDPYGELVFDETNSFVGLSGNHPYTFPFAVSRNIDFPVKDVNIRFRFLPHALTQGAGIALSDNAPVYPVDPGYRNLFIDVWPISSTQYKVFSTVCPRENIDCTNLYTDTTIVGDFSNDWHILKVNFVDSHFEIFFDGVLKFASADTDKRLKVVWLGSPIYATESQAWPNFDIDYVRVTSLDPEALRPIVIVPGHQASWNYVQMLGLPVGNEWKIPPFITLYNNLINSLKNAGYQEGVNLFVYGYDWRKKIGDAADDLKNFVNGLGLTGKIDFIGHSYGGLVTRGYAQEWGTDKIDKILELGSPNLGTVNAYGAWEGGVFWNTKWWQKGIMETLIHINKLTGGPLLETKIDTIRRVAPSIRDTLPTFGYLVRDGVMLPETSMLQRNDGLPGLNDSIGGIDSLLKVIGGIGTQTRQKINTVERSDFDALFGLWEDGRPVIDNPFVFSNEGDDTVLSFSSIGPFSNSDLINQNHGGLVSSREGIEKIFDELGLDKTKIVTTTAADTRERVFVAMLRSPGTLHVCAVGICDGDLGIYLPLQKLFMWPDFGEDNLTISIEANEETGPYKLVTGKIDGGGADWRETDGSLDSLSETDSYHLTSIFDTTPPVITPHVSPEPNAADWNNSMVAVTWEVSDPESVIISSTGCGTTTIDTETLGTNITCSATSNGGTSTRTATVKLDKIRPVIIGSVSPSPNSHGWNNSDVAYSFVCSDVGVIQSGIAEDTLVGNTLTTEGASQSVSNTGNCIDQAENAADAVTISNVNIDKTEPGILINSPVSGANYSLNASIIADWSTVDSLSRIEDMNGTVASGSPVDTESLGEKPFTVTATDFAGNTNTQTINYNVVGYTINNFLKPFSSNKVFKNGSTVPIKFQLVDALGRYVPYVRAQLNVNDVPAVSSGLANTDSYFRYDPFTNQYIFNLSTRMFLLTRAPYHLDIYLDGVHNYTAEIAMK